ncbi:MAG: hypothetical protein BRC49_12595 [Cyanobacteria bacterium SW_10_48_33]|jgi:hypothetical protein|nr:MAG: hypothetical protein BRC45_04255 [Cyanobacteria bacterium QS_5_48_63]PSO95205.1 MAG: hypothetical protein BRC46_03320 [Cyanobacteria bacterium QS_6_48_18]PSP09517.1 MAG: hypothetical protein BRC49_12595 [Cyanobacteria bacterium SW_10_48_33]PSP23913.1 MAG: hypothetical protein BRC52_01255 [Cyanobacteria bacterium SW_5_48_44]
MIGKIFWNTLLFSPVFVGVTYIVSGSAIATETTPETLAEGRREKANVLEKIRRYSNNDIGQVNSASQLRDVSPSDWAYEALRNLVERYGCIEGYPNGTFRGNRAITRYEFAAGLNACLQEIEGLIAASADEEEGKQQQVAPEDLETLERLVQEFQAELATLGTQVDNLEERASVLEENQFSTTTQLSGEVVFGLGSVLAGEDVDEGEELDEVPVLGHRTRLELETSFTGEDLLFTRLSAGNFPQFGGVTGTPQGEIAFAEGQVTFAQGEGNDIGLEVLLYSFPITDSSEVWLLANGGAADDFADTVNFLDGDGGSGAVSVFGTRNSIYYGVGDTGIALRNELGDNLELSLGYVTSEANEPSPGNGLFNGPYSALAQLVFTPSDSFNLGLTYVHSYNQQDTGTGSDLSNFRSFTDEQFGVGAVPTSSNSYGVELSWQLSDHFVLGGWASYRNATTLSTLGGTIERGNLDIWNWAVTLAFPDLGKEGSLGGIVVGMEPRVTDSSINLPNLRDEDEDSSLHLEAFYEYHFTDNIAVTPGVIWVTDPNHDNDNDDLVIGVVRTTFTF